MWKCVFDSKTKRGITCNREPQRGEFSENVCRIDVGWFNVHPSRYMWNGDKIIGWPGWEKEEQDAVTPIPEAQCSEEQASVLINEKLDAAKDEESVKEAVREILLNLVPHIFKG